MDQRPRGLLIAVVLVLISTTLGLSPSVAAANHPAIVRAAFYYAWFPRAWHQDNIYPYSLYTPSLGYYSSSNKHVIQKQIAAMQYAHLDAGIISWWGSSSNAVVAQDLAVARGTGFRWTLYYELQGYSNPSVKQIRRDLRYIDQRFTHSPAYLRIGGKPVIFVYAGPEDGCDMARRWRRANAGIGFFTVLKVFPGYRSCADDASGWHQYAPVEAEDYQPGYSFTISPGFDKVGDPAPLLPRDLARWEDDVQAMVASHAPFQLVTTFNEWGEGTAVESAHQLASRSGYGEYLDVLHRELPALG